MSDGIAIPTLPGRDLVETEAFYSRLGFQNLSAPEFRETYAILKRGSLELHFFLMPELVPTESYAGCYLRVTDVEALFRSFAAQSLPTTGIPRMGHLEDKPWGMREFYIVDPSGNLLRIGQII